MMNRGIREERGFAICEICTTYCYKREIDEKYVGGKREDIIGGLVVEAPGRKLFLNLGLSREQYSVLVQ